MFYKDQEQMSSVVYLLAILNEKCFKIEMQATNSAQYMHGEFQTHFIPVQNDDQPN